MDKGRYTRTGNWKAELPNIIASQTSCASPRVWKRPGHLFPDSGCLAGFCADSKAVNLKVDELIRVLGGARNHLVDIERLSDQELRTLQKEFERIGQKADEANARASEVKEELASR